MPSLQGFIQDGNRFVVTDKKKPYGKITGTGMAGLLGRSKWTSPFITTARMLRLYNEDISAKKEVHAGVVIEPKILDYIGAVHGDDMFEKRVGDHEDWKSDFEDDIFGGHIDGMMPDGSIVEVKTTRNPEDWINGPPEYYWIQASLYAHFMKADKIIFAVGFTDEKTLAEPESFVANERTVAKFVVPIIDRFDDMLKEAKAIYEDTVLKGRTAEKGPGSMDSRVFDLISAQIWTDEQLESALSDYRIHNKMLEGYKQVEKEMQDTKDALMLYMKAHELTDKECKTDIVKLSRYSRTSVDTDALKRDGIYETYSKKTEVESIKLVKRY